MLSLVGVGYWAAGNTTVTRFVLEVVGVVVVEEKLEVLVFGATGEVDPGT